MDTNTDHFTLLALCVQGTLLLLLLTGTIFSYFCMSSITNFSYFDSNCSIVMIFIVIDDITFQ